MRYIVDEPAKVDLFNTHSPVAQAIARAINDNPTIKVIGLLGKWGSGKSTIIREVSEALAVKNANHLTFTYDAWLHQHDPLRRSFFESVVSYLAENELIDQERWEKRAKKLSGELEVVDTIETPIVPFEAKLFIALAAIFTFGLSFFDGAAIAEGWGALTTEEGVWNLRFGTVLPIASIFSWICYIILSKKRGKHLSFFPNLIINKQLQHNHTEILRPLDATSIEFGKAFQDLMKEMQECNIKLTIVVDNIDRVNEAEALEIWSNIRSFFLSSHSDNEISSEIFHPSVILPIDYQSLSKIFAVGNSPESGGRLARSFVNKTFDATFTVPAQVLSNWKMYLSNMMQYALESEYTEERYFVTRRFVERWFATTKTHVTPREINQIINQIVSLCLQWDGRQIPFEVMAYFAVNIHDIDGGIETEIKRNDHPLAEFSKDWRLELAALHFGVEVSEAAQVLVSDPLRDAIRKNDPSLIEPYKKVSGFGDIFEDVTRDLPASDDEQAPADVILHAALLLEDDLGEGPWRTSATRNLVEAFKAVKAGSSLSKFAPLAFRKIFDFANSTDAPALIQTSERLLDPEFSKPEISVGSLEICARAGDETMKFAHRHEVTEPLYDLKADAQVYCSRVVVMNDFPLVQQRVRTSAGNDDICAELVRRIQTEPESSTAPNLVALFVNDGGKTLLRDSDIEFSNVYSAAESVIRESAPESATFQSGLRILLLAGHEFETRRDAMKRVASDNTLLSKLPGINGLGHVDLIAGALAFLIAAKIEIEAPTKYSWKRYFRTRSGLAKKINVLLDTFFEMELPVDLLLASYEVSYKNHDLVNALMNDRVTRNELGRLDNGKILKNFSNYAKTVDFRYRDRFAKRLTNYPKFWLNLTSMAWSSEIFSAAQLLLSKGGAEAERAKDELSKRLNGSSVEEWDSAIKAGKEPFNLATELFRSDEIKMGVKSNLFQSLVSILDKSHDAVAQQWMRWFRLSRLLTVPAQKRALSKLRDYVFKAAPKTKIRILKEGGEGFISDNAFRKDPDAAVEKMILPLIQSQLGRRFLKDRMVEMRPLVRKASSKHRLNLTKAVTAIENSKIEGATHWAEVIKREWLLKEPTRPHPIDPRPSIP